MNKRVKLNNGNILIINISPGYCCDTFSIYEGYVKDNTVLKSLELSIWDDMAFNAYTSDDSVNCVEFGIDINHPLYFCVKQLLADDDQLIIDDDNTFEHLQKYMVIKRDEAMFKFIFVNNMSEKIGNPRRFGAFIKNIGPDFRSKISDFSIKLRLVDFFRDAERRLLEEYHQLTFDECLEFARQKEESNKVKKIKYSTPRILRKEE